MPREIFKKEYERLIESGLSDVGAVKQLANIFEVSKIACAIRINNIYDKNVINNYSIFE